MELLANLGSTFVSRCMDLLLGRDRLKLYVMWGSQPNADEIGTFLCLNVKVVNPGNTSIFFERIEAVDRNGETYFPLYWGLKAGHEIPPKNNVVGRIPCGHVAKPEMKELRVYDATERRYRLRGRGLRKVVRGLIEEIDRLEGLGFEVHSRKTRERRKSTS
ncbi:hypothetical protein [Salinisphaera sp. PC39]|uniref:hypothetical protein n=1 Tax=Salinisphaera sp. PC39 TaxID=1304156 RepID=UPI00333E83EF